MLRPDLLLMKKISSSFGKDLKNGQENVVRLLQCLSNCKHSEPPIDGSEQVMIKWLELWQNCAQLKAWSVRP